MPSPFPGMDPYLESPVYWSDFHARFINDLADTITEALPPEYFAAIGEYVSLLGPNPSSIPRDVVPDVAVVAPPWSPSDIGAGPGSAAAVAETELRPATLRNRRLPAPEVQYYIELVRLPDHEPVTVIEVLSPKNKRGGGRGVYVDKRNATLWTPVNLVEIDLLRGGRRVGFEQPLPAGDYFAMVSYGTRRPMCDVYAWTVRHRLPVVPIPLREPTPDVRVDLGRAFRATYDRGRFGRRIDRRRPPPAPPLTADDATWAAAVATGRPVA